MSVSNVMTLTTALSSKEMTVNIVGNRMTFKFGPNPNLLNVHDRLARHLTEIRADGKEEATITDEELQEMLADLKLTKREQKAIRSILRPVRGMANHKNRTYLVLEVVASVIGVLLLLPYMSHMPVAPQLAYAASMGMGMMLEPRTFSAEKAFSPLTELIRDLANPICYVMLIIGFIYVMIGRANEGFKRMQYAAMGYIGIQLAPGLMDIIKNVGSSMIGVG